MVLVDSNVLIDYLTEDPVWWPLTEQVLSKIVEEDKLAINPIIYAELAGAYRNEDEFSVALPESEFVRLDLPYAAAFLAGQCLRPVRSARRFETLAITRFLYWCSCHGGQIHPRHPRPHALSHVFSRSFADSPVI
jgi:predicted nucleic acid-binding protein